MKNDVKVNKKGSVMATKARVLVIEVANKTKREMSKNFRVVDIEKISIRDITHNERLSYTPQKINPPKFHKDTPIEVQKLVIDAYIFQKQNNGFLYTTMIDIDTLYPAICQRTVDKNRVTKIAKEFSTAEFTPVKLVYFDGDKYFSIKDGQTHASAAKELNIPKIPGSIELGKSIEEVSSDFAHQHDNTKTLRPVEKYEAGLLAKDEDCVAINEVCNAFRIKLAGNSTKYPKTVHSMRAIRRIVREYGGDGLRFVFQMIIDAGWEKQTKAYEESTLNIGYSALEVINENEGDFNYDKFIKELKSYGNVVDCLVHMKNEVGSFSTDRHPESTPKLYMMHKYGK